jgi:hypothetical protein
MTTFSYDSLYNKSKLFIQRAIVYRHERDYDNFQLWAALSLELLGKAALAKIHPSLIADPNNIDSMFAACGHPISTKAKTIQARTVFERLKHVSKAFSSQAEKFCFEISERRNSELHSGELPFTGMVQDSWVISYWKVCKIILEAQSKDFNDWLGREEAKDVEDIISKRTTALKQTVLARINKCRKEINAKFPNKEELKEMRKKGAIFFPSTFMPLFGTSTGDTLTGYFCPSCACLGALSGELWNEETIQTEDNEFDQYLITVVLKTYTSLAFRCKVCGLKLDGLDEIKFAGIDEEFSEESEREPDYEPDYGND